MAKQTSLKERISLYCSGFNSYLIVSLASTYLVYFYTDIFLVPKHAVNILMIFARVWDAINDSIMGSIVDRTRTKIGRMRPYLRYGAFPMAAIIVMMFLPISMPVALRIAYASFTYIIFGMLYTLTDIPLWGLLSIVSSDRDERASLLSTTATVGAVGAIMPMLIFPVLSSVVGEKATYTVMAVFVAVLTTVTMLVTYKNTTERIEMPKEKSNIIQNFKIAFKNRPMIATILCSMLGCTRYLMQLAAIYIATYVFAVKGLDSGIMLLVLYLLVGLGMLLGMVFTQPLYKRVGYKAVCIGSGILGAVSLSVAFFIGYSNFFVIIPFLILGGIPLGIYNVIIFPMIGDSLDYLEWKTGNRCEGFCFSLQSFSSKFNQAFAAIALTSSLIIVNYVQPEKVGDQIAQSDSTKSGLYALVTLLPAIGFALSILPMLFYNFTGAKKEQILKELNQRKILATDDIALKAAAALDGDSGFYGDVQ